MIDHDTYEDLLPDQRMREFPEKSEDIAISPWFSPASKKQYNKQQILKMFGDGQQTTPRKSSLLQHGKQYFERKRRKSNIECCRQAIMNSHTKNLEIYLPKIPTLSPSYFQRMPIKRSKTEATESLQKELIYSRKKNQCDLREKKEDSPKVNKPKKPKKLKKLEFKDLNFLCLKNNKRKQGELWEIKRNYTAKKYLPILFDSHSCRKLT